MYIDVRYENFLRSSFVY